MHSSQHWRFHAQELPGQRPRLSHDTYRRLPYQRPPISKAYLLGNVNGRRVAFRPAACFQRRGISLLSGRSATAVDRATRTVRLDLGANVEYDHLLLATGSRPRILLLRGHSLDRPGVRS